MGSSKKMQNNKPTQDLGRVGVRWDDGMNRQEEE